MVRREAVAGIKVKQGAYKCDREDRGRQKVTEESKEGG